MNATAVGSNTLRPPFSSIRHVSTMSSPILFGQPPASLSAAVSYTLNAPCATSVPCSSACARFTLAIPKK